MFFLVKLFFQFIFVCPRDLSSFSHNRAMEFGKLTDNVVCSTERSDFSVFPDISNFYEGEDLDFSLSFPNITLNHAIDTPLVHGELVKVPASVLPLNDPDPYEMRHWILAAFVLILLRVIVENRIFKPIGLYLGIKARPKLTFDKIPCRNTEAIPILESFYKLKPFKKKPKYSQISCLSSQTGLQAREVERWLRQRRAIDRTSKLTKFTESGWRFVCYVISTSIGIWALRDKKWIWDVNTLWMDFPNHIIPTELRLYYLYGSGLYLSFLITQAFDVRRKDFWEMFVHHIVTISLLVSSWSLNMVRVGSIVIILHDCADIFLELAKMANYAKNEFLSTSTFVVFTMIWIGTRLYLYPKKIIWENSLVIIRVLPAHVCYPIVALLVVLFCLHLFWTYFICKIALTVINPGIEKQRDARSSTESSSSESETDETRHLQQQRPRELQQNFKSLSFSSSLLAKIDSNQRKIMKRISSEIM